MVRRFLSYPRALTTAVVCLSFIPVVASSAVPLASAANRRIAISDFAWSDAAPEIDLGEKVTWYWTGPDVLHSVTGSGSPAAGIDSDADRSTPLHSVGDSFTWTFTAPGTYRFVCKIHGSLPGGTVTVSSSPGDPANDPDPVPENLVDVIAPRISAASLSPSAFPARVGSELMIALNERATVTAEIWGLKAGRLGRYAGWREWSGHIGFNWLEFGKASKRFKPRPGRYRALIYATDEWNNEARPRRVDFSIR